jgi:hypothetical protein
VVPRETPSAPAERAYMATDSWGDDLLTDPEQSALTVLTGVVCWEGLDQPSDCSVGCLVDREALPLRASIIFRTTHLPNESLSPLEDATGPGLCWRPPGSSGRAAWPACTLNRDRSGANITGYR